MDRAMRLTVKATEDSGHSPGRAIAALTRYVHRRPTSPLAGLALFNAGYVASYEDCDLAERLLEGLTRSGVRDDEPSGELMDPFRNYRHRAFVIRSRCARTQGKAMMALVLALQSVPVFVTHCGTCRKTMEASVRVSCARALTALAPNIETAALGSLLQEPLPPAAFVERALALISDADARKAVERALMRSGTPARKG